IERYYNQAHHDDPDGPFFGRPSPISPHIERVRSFSGQGEVLDLRWPSQFEPLWSIEALTESLRGDNVSSELAVELLSAIERARLDRAATLRQKYLASTHNMTAYARWYRHRGQPRAC